MSTFKYQEPFPQGPDQTTYRQLTGDYVTTRESGGHTLVKVERQGLVELAAQALIDTSHLLRPEHLAQVAAILDDPEASGNDRFVALEMLKNANISAGMVLPMCQDTGTAVVVGKKGQYVWTEGDDPAALSEGITRTYIGTNLRYSQMAPLSMYEEVNTGNNLPAQIDIYAADGSEYKFLFMAKGGGSANKVFLYQQNRAVLNPESLTKFIDEKIRMLGTAACPPYHLAIVIGGTSAEANLKTVKMASAHDLEAEVLRLSQRTGIGAQFGGKYFCHDVRVIRLPRHGASLPIGIGVSCSADRQIKAKITGDGLFLEALERDPAKYLPEVDEAALSGDVVELDLNQPMAKLLETLSRYPVKTRFSLTGSMVVARDIAHAKLKDRLDAGKGLPQYFKDHMVYYAGPAKTPKGMASGSFGPTTAGRMDSYVDQFQAAGGSMVMLAKGNRGKQVREACHKHGGFYLGSVGGPAAALAQNAIRKVEVLEYEELGMEAIWRIDVENFPAVTIIDDKGNDFFADLTP